jgi:uncharacterized protein (TIGR03083 family)
MTEDSSWTWLRGEVTKALEGFRSNLQAQTGNRMVPNLVWTVAELTAHLAALPRLYRAQNELGDSFEPPTDWARFSIEQRSHIDTADLASVANHLQSEVVGFLDEIEQLGDLDGQRWLYGQPTTHRNVVLLVLSELIVHGQDLGRLTGTVPELTRRQANAVLPAMFAVVPAFVDQTKASGAAGVYHLSFRGGDDWTYRITDSGEVLFEKGRPARCDAHLSADPAAFLLVVLGRRNSTLAALKGQMLVWGRRPWKFMATTDISVAGV